MKTLFAILLLASLALMPQKAAAQTITTPALPGLTLPSVTIPTVTIPTVTIPTVTIPAVTIPELAAQRITAGHALALGVGLFAGAVAGSVLIHGGALAAAIGGVAGLAVGHWAWTEAEQD